MRSHLLPPGLLALAVSLGAGCSVGSPSTSPGPEPRASSAAPQVTLACVGNERFPGPASLPTGDAPRSVSAADLNGDGVIDVVAAAEYGTYVFIGTGRGEFAQGVKYATFQAHDVIVTDLDGDGVRDLAVLAEEYVDVLLGKGDGTFGAPASFKAHTLAYKMAAADFNGDGAPDLALSAWGGTAVSVLLGKGDGTFGAVKTYPAGDPSDVAAGDLDGDGAMDFVVADSAGAGALYGNGDGTFGPLIDLGLSPGVSGVALGDLDGDGTLDVVAAAPAAIDVVLHASGRTFAAPVSYAALAGGPAWSTLADISGDGHLDVVAGQSTNQTLVFLGQGDGTLAPFTSYGPTGPQYGSSGPAAVADFDGDGYVDLAIPDWQYEFGFVRLVMGLANGKLQEPVLVPQRGTEQYAVVAADFNGDRHLDLAFAAEGLHVALGRGDGTFGPTNAFGGGKPHALVVDDFDGDGVLDAVIPHAKNLAFWHGVGDGTFTKGGSYPVAGEVVGLSAADLDGDGARDLVLATDGFKSGASWLQVLLGRGDGTFGAAQTVLSELASPMVVADLDGDGIPDLAVAADSGFELLAGKGDGTFRKPVTTKFYPDFGLATADFNEDGHADLAWCTGSSVQVGLGDGAFHLTLQDTLHVQEGNLVFAADVNLDGHADLLVLPRGSEGDHVALFLGKGDGSFSAPRSFAAAPGGIDVAVGDFDEDGKNDLAVAVDCADEATVLLNRSKACK